MKSAIKITAIYAAAASLWIIFTDKIIAAMTRDPEFLTRYASMKGLLFVVITGTLLFILINREMRIRNAIIERLNDSVRSKTDLIEELHHRIKTNLQVVIGLMNLETDSLGFTQETKTMIENKLVSMQSVYNVVYSDRTLHFLSFRSVLEEYSKLSFKNIKIENADGNASVETMVTLLVVMDAIIEGVQSWGYNGLIIVRFAGNNAIDLVFEELNADIHAVLGSDEAFCNLYLESIGGSMETLPEPIPGIRVEYAIRSDGGDRRA